MIGKSNLNTIAYDKKLCAVEEFGRKCGDEYDIILDLFLFLLTIMWIMICKWFCTCELNGLDEVV